MKKGFSKISLMLFCSATLLYKSSFAQSGLSLGTSAAYLYSYRHLKMPDGSDSYKQQRDQESPVSSYFFSIDALYQFKGNWNLTSGLSISNPGYQRDLSDFKFGDQITEGGFTGPAEAVDEIETKYRITRMSVPLLVGYRLPLGENNKHSLLFRLGVSNHFLIDMLVRTEIEFKDGTSKHSTQDISSYYEFYSLSATANIGYFYRFNKHSLGLSLLGDYGLPITQTRISGMKESIYYGGVGLTYLHQLN